MNVYIYTYIYIRIYKERERESEDFYQLKVIALVFSGGKKKEVPK